MRYAYFQGGNAAASENVTYDLIRKKLNLNNETEVKILKFRVKPSHPVDELGKLTKSFLMAVH